MRRPNRRFLFLAFFILLLCVNPLLLAQADEDSDNEYPDTSAPAMLSLYQHAGGTTSVTFYSPIPVAKMDEVREALSTALHCPSTNLRSPEYPTQNITDPEQRRQYEDAQKRVFSHQLSAACPGIVRKNELRSSLDLQLTPLTQALGKNHIHRLTVTFIARQLPNVHTSALGEVNVRHSYGMLTFDVDIAHAPGSIHIEWGYAWSDLRVTVLTALLFIVVPCVVILWMRRRALQLHSTDRSAAWFSYIRTQHLCLTGMLLVWIGGSYTTRNEFESILSAAWGVQSLRVALLSVLYVFVPPIVVLLVSVLASYRILLEVRQIEWGFGDFLKYQLSQLGTIMIPALGIYAGLQLLTNFSLLGICVLGFSALSLPLLASLRRRLTGSYPEPITSGEFHDRIMLLARRAGVAIRNITLLPSGKLPVANALAAGNGTVMVTDYILQKLNRREVEAVAAHEIGHLQYKHPQKLAAAFVGVILVPIFARLFVPTILELVPIGSGSRMIGQDFLPPSADFVMAIICLLGFYALSRHFERVADARSVTLTDDPEALITAFVKLSAVNLTPLQWNGASEALVTHPSTLKRVKRLAALGNVNENRLQALISDPHINDSSDGSGQIFPSPRPAADRVFPPREQLQRAQISILILVLISTAVPAVFAYFATLANGNTRYLVLLAGVIVSFVSYLIVLRWRIVDGRDKIREKFVKHMQKQYPGLDLTHARLIGYSPEAWPRFYYVQSHWDTGMLLLTRDGLVFLGDETRFRLPYSAIKELVLSQGISSWWNFKRSYIRWQQGNRRGVMNLLSLDPCSPWKIARSNRTFHELLQEALNSQGSLPPASSDCQSFDVPEPIKTKGKNPREAYSLKAAFKLVLVAGVVAVFMANSTFTLFPMLYIPAVVFAIRFFESIPYRRYKDRPLSPEWIETSSVPIPVEKQGLTQSAT